MPLIGKAASAFSASGLSGGDKFALLAAGLRDLARSQDEDGGGNGPTALMQAQALLGARQQEAKKQAFLGQLGGLLQGRPAQFQDGPAPNLQPPQMPQAPSMQDPSAAISQAVSALTPKAPQQAAAPFTYQPPTKVAEATPGLNINDPRLPMIALQAEQADVPITSLLDVFKAQQPDVHYDRGFGYNGKTGDPMGAFHPDLDKGQGLGPDGGVVNLPGAVQAAAEMAGGVSGAQESAKAPFAFQTVIGPDGRPRVISNATAAALGSNGGIISQGPSQAQTAADVARANAGAQADITLPQTLGTAQQAIGLIEQMKAHPGLDSRTGWRGLLPALPNTPGADFDAMQSQLKGKLFLQAYGDLKGAGQISEIEGKKATDAMARLQNSQTKEGYLSALQDLEDVINAGAQRAAGQAQRLQPAAGGRAAAPSATPARAAGPTMAGRGYKILSVE